MNNDLFHIALHRDIYHTLSLWSLLSPGLAGQKKARLSSTAENAVKPETNDDTVDLPETKS